MLENISVTKKFTTLVEAARDDEDALEMIERSMNSFVLYVQAVYAMEVKIPILRFRCDATELGEAIMELDRSRRNAHEGAIASVKILNRICKMFDVAPLFEGNTEDRLAIAEFCSETVAAFFRERKGTDRTLSIKDWLDAAQKNG